MGPNPPGSCGGRRQAHRGVLRTRNSPVTFPRGGAVSRPGRSSTYPRLSPATSWAYAGHTPVSHESGVCASGSRQAGGLAPRSGGSYRPPESRGVCDHPLHPVVAARLGPLLWRCRFAPARLVDVGTPGFRQAPVVPTGLARQGSAFPCSVRSQRNDPGPSLSDRGRFVSIGSRCPRVEGPLFRVKTFGMKPLRHTLHGRCSDGRPTVILTRSAGAFVPATPPGAAPAVSLSTASGTGRSGRLSGRSFRAARLGRCRGGGRGYRCPPQGRVAIRFARWSLRGGPHVMWRGPLRSAGLDPEL